MIGNQYKLFGTDNIFEITGDQNDYWVITVRSSNEQTVDVLMAKKDLNDSIQQGSLKKT